MTAIEDAATTPVTDPETPMPALILSPTNVIAALARVEAEVGGIEKTKKEGDGGGGVPYKFRGIDAISQAAQPLLGKYGVVMVPTVENHVVDDIQVGSPPKPWTDTTVTVLWKIYGPGGVTDMIECRTVGLGRDNSDKGMNKAMTGAFKNVLLRVLCIGDPQDDTDGDTHERAAAAAPPPEFSERSLAAYAALSGLSDDAKDNLKALSAEYGHKLTAPDMDDDEGWLLVVEGVILNDKRVAPSGSADTPEAAETAAEPDSEHPEPTEPVNPAEEAEVAAEGLSNEPKGVQDVVEGRQGDIETGDGAGNGKPPRRTAAQIAADKKAQAGLPIDEPVDPSGETP